jgi:ABC-type multidrug transport system fused ATPase/permease subunit
MPDMQLTIEIKPLRRFLVWGTQYWVSLIFAILTGSLVALAASLATLVTGQLFTHALPGGNQLLLQYLPLVLAGLLIAATLASLAGYHTLYRICSKLVLELRIKMFEKLLLLPHACSEFSITTITSNFFTNTEELLNSATRLAVNLSRDLLTVTGLLTVMIYLSREMSLLAFTILIAAYLIDQIPRIGAYRKDMLTQGQAEISAMIHKTLHHYRVIHLDKGGTQESQHTRNILEQFRVTSLKQHNNIKLVELLALLFLIGMLTAFIYYLIQQIILNKLAIGDTVAFLTALLLLIFPLKRLMGIKPSLEQCSNTLQAIFLLLDQQIPSAIENPHGLHFKHARGKLNFRHVSFQDDIALKAFQSPIDLNLEPGTRMALTNSDNRAKQSLADLVCGFMSPKNGRILLDNRDINQIAHADLHANIAWVAPDKTLLADTIAANIAYGAMRGSTEASITAAAYASQATEFIREMPHGFQTKINNKDVTLSDNQRQRILIARAILKNPAIVILDETTAYFDADSPPLLHALSTLIKGRTTLILSSRPAITSLAQHMLNLNQAHASISSKTLS